MSLGRISMEKYSFVRYYCKLVFPIFGKNHLFTQNIEEVHKCIERQITIAYIKRKKALCLKTIIYHYALQVKMLSVMKSQRDQGNCLSHLRFPSQQTNCIVCTYICIFFFILQISVCMDLTINLVMANCVGNGT